MRSFGFSGKTASKVDHEMDKWSVLILSAGYGNELLRSEVRRSVEEIGMLPRVYDAPGYLVDPDVHSHEACVRAINENDIIVALVDEKEGGDFQDAKVGADAVEWLKSRDILRPSPCPPSTILQVEVLTARELKKPVLVFVPKTIQTAVHEYLTQLRSKAIQPTPRSGATDSADSLIARGDWRGLHEQYQVPKATISFRQASFIESLRKETPNFISFCDLSNLAQLREEIQSRLAGTFVSFVRKISEKVSDRIETKRDPIGQASLRDLVEANLLVSPPYAVESGQFTTGPLFPVTGQSPIADSLFRRRNILLIGPPGLGKTTLCLLSFRDLEAATKSSIEGARPVFASCRELGLVHSTDELLRMVVGSGLGRENWPDALRIPTGKWVLVLDGIDEWPVDSAAIATSLLNLSKGAVLLASCRSYDFESRLHVSNENFHILVRLSIWGNAEIKTYADRLQAAGRTAAADYIKSLLDTEDRSEILSVPLWLSMLTFLAENSLQKSIPARSDYQLLDACFNAVALQEIKRQGAGISVAALKQLWSTIAWCLHRSRREGKVVRLDDLQNALKIQPESPEARAVLSVLDVGLGFIAGFFHEVFHEHWLAEYVGERLTEGQSNPDGLVEALSFQRSVVTNKLIRERIDSKGEAARCAQVLRDVFWSANTSEASQFAKNQILYLLGRIDNSLPTKSFLRTIWSSQEPPFVRYSAAYAVIGQGDMSTESEYYRLLSKSKEDDEINRGYHLFYYADVDYPENKMPYRDDSSSDAGGALRRLFRRLGKKEDRHRFLRRIELFTVRRFLETGRKVPPDVNNPSGTVERLKVEGTNAGDTEFGLGLSVEIDRVLLLLRSSSS